MHFSVKKPQNLYFCFLCWFLCMLVLLVWDYIYYVWIILHILLVLWHINYLFNIILFNVIFIQVKLPFFQLLNLMTYFYLKIYKCNHFFFDYTWIYCLVYDILIYKCSILMECNLVQLYCFWVACKKYEMLSELLLFFFIFNKNKVNNFKWVEIFVIFYKLKINFTYRAHFLNRFETVFLL